MQLYIKTIECVLVHENWCYERSKNPSIHPYKVMVIKIIQKKKEKNYEWDNGENEI